MRAVTALEYQPISNAVMDATQWLMQWLMQ
jgi:hypothetical protein